VVANRLKKEADDRAHQIVREANRRPDDLVAEARKKLPCSRRPVLPNG
jgi:vacuolar-type H+-ATPase subunit E/Vma4